MTKTHLEGQPRVLVVETDRPLAKLVALTLNHGLYETATATSVDEADRLLTAFKPHLLIVDVDVEREGALALLGTRAGRQRIPTIAFTRRGDLAVKLAAFQHGADDIVIVPFVPEELVARVLALMRRTYGDAVPFIPVIKVAGLEVDLLNQNVRMGEDRPRLTAIELALLYLLAANAGQVIGRDEILDSIWGADFVAESNVVDHHIKNLRLKLKDDPRRPRFIGTVAGKGYRFLGTPTA